MKNQHYRYFIELQAPDGEPVPRPLEDETRRDAARGFIENMRQWLKDKELGEKVSALSVTVFGQIHITCEQAIIKLIRDREDVDIVAIRQSAIHTDAPGRWNAAH